MSEAAGQQIQELVVAVELSCRTLALLRAYEVGLVPDIGSALLYVPVSEQQGTTNIRCNLGLLWQILVDAVAGRLDLSECERAVGRRQKKNHSLGRALSWELGDCCLHIHADLLEQPAHLCLVRAEQSLTVQHSLKWSGHSVQYPRGPECTAILIYGNYGLATDMFRLLGTPANEVCHCRRGPQNHQTAR